jgi:hypothetical protein
MTYWRSSQDCFSIDFKGIITEICESDLGYGDMDRMDGVFHAANGCKKKRHMHAEGRIEPRRKCIIADGRQ